LGKRDFFGWFFVVKLWWFRGGTWCVDGGFSGFRKMSSFENISVEKTFGQIAREASKWNGFKYEYRGPSLRSG
jgi:hypothetical protein